MSDPYQLEKLLKLRLLEECEEEERSSFVQQHAAVKVVRDGRTCGVHEELGLHIGAAQPRFSLHECPERRVHLRRRWRLAVRVAALVVPWHSRAVERAYALGGLDPLEGALYVERYQLMQLGGPLSAVRDSDASSISGSRRRSSLFSHLRHRRRYGA